MRAFAFFLFSIVFAFAIASTAVAQATDYTLVWFDEFSGSGAINSDLWFHQTQLPAGGSWYNGEQQHYTNRTANANVANGMLRIVAIKENFTDQGQTKQYTSARLNSKYAFTYGRVDVRAKLPSGAGTWPAIWMLGQNINEPGGYFSSQFGRENWPACGEIDIMEHWGNNPNVIHGSLHTTSSSGATVNTKTTVVSQVSTTFHVYSMIWDESKIQFLVDDVAFYTYSPTPKNNSNWPFNKPQYLLLNIAMGGIGGAIDPTFTSSMMEIDYVRVYQKGGTPVRRSQSIVFPPIEDKTIGDPSFQLAASASSTLPVVYSTASDNISISGNTVTIIKAGRAVIKANQAGDAAHDAAAEVAQSFCIKPQKPTISTSASTATSMTLVSNATNGNSWFLNGVAIPTATGATFVATTQGSYKVQVAVGGCASEFSSEVVFGPAVTPVRKSQFIIFPTIDDKTVGDASFQLTASASSTLPVVFLSATDNVTITGSTVNIIRAGRAVIKANQSGDAFFNAAAESVQSFCVNPLKPLIATTETTATSITLASNATIGNSWFLNGVAIPSATDATLVATTNGNYKVRVAIGDCMSEFSSEVAFVITSTQKDMEEAVSVFPNPADTILEVRGVHSERSNFQLVDLAGKKMTLDVEKQNGVSLANVQHLNTGIYILQIQDGPEVRHIKVVKK